MNIVIFYLEQYLDFVGEQKIQLLLLHHKPQLIKE